jgi:hypothetical protein
MNLKKPLLQSTFALAMGTIAMGCVTATATEQDPKERHVSIKIEKSNDQNAMVDLTIDGQAEAFVLPKLEMGETKTITTESGKTIIAKQTEKGLSLDIDGKNIMLPPQPHKNKLSAHMQRVMPLHQRVNNGVQISGVELDDNQKQIIKNAFIAAGVDKKINFSNNQFVFITKDSDVDGEMVRKIELHKGAKHREWTNEDGENVEVIIERSANGESETHEINKEVIIIEKRED